MFNFVEKHRKRIFWMMIVAVLLTIWVYNFLTPYYTDDMFYAMEISGANSFWDLVKQQYLEYMTKNCRAIGQFNIRLSLIQGKWLFNVVNSVMFVALVLLLYKSISNRKPYDVFLLLLSVLFVWRYSVKFGETNLWLCGSCNYLWGSVIIMGFLTWYRYLLKKMDELKHPIGVAIGCYFFGLVAGWCNENTSGGALLLVLFFTMAALWQKEDKKHIKPFVITGTLGVLSGLMAMVFCPGVRNRLGAIGGENFTGLPKILSRIYKITVTVRELFGELIIIFVIVMIILVLQKKFCDWKSIVTNSSILFFVSAFATSYALVMIPPMTERAHYGAGIFLMAAGLNAIAQLERKELFVKTLQYGLASILCLWLFSTYFENLVNLYRINRETNERIEIIQEEKNKYGKEAQVVIPQLRPEFDNPYSAAYNADLEDDAGFWINLFYEDYYGVNSIVAIPREEWEEVYGAEEQE